MISGSLSGIWAAAANHLWQSTLFAAGAAILALVLRNNQARVRYGIWLAASLKFLIPFSLLIGLGSHLARPHAAAIVESGLYSTAEEVGQPFTRTVTLPVASTARAGRSSLPIPLLPETLFTVWLCGFSAALALWWLRWRRISAVVRSASPIAAGREIDALRQLERMTGVRKPIPLLLSQESQEPGVFGIVRPVLVWPAGISERLQQEQLMAILAHELRHVRRRDNLGAAIHMVAEAVFWFHPLLWWLERRLVEERERACDEEVLQSGCAPQVYAESILKTCEFCVGPSLPCIAGVSGADLKKRIVRIMTPHIPCKLDLGGKLLLAASATVAVTAPVLFGLITAPLGRAQSQTASSVSGPTSVAAALSQAAPQPESTPAKVPAFEVASIKPDKSGSGMVRILFTNDGFSATNLSLTMLIREAYGMEESQISGAPGWINSQNYDIEAKVDGSSLDALHKLRLDQRRVMLQSLLTDRFQLKAHRETKELPVYALVVTKNGPKFQEAKPGDTYPNGIKGPDGHGGSGMMMLHADGKTTQLTAQAVPMASLVRFLSDRLGRNVLDKTGLMGKYDFTMQLPPEEGLAPNFHRPPGSQQETDDAIPPESSGPSIFTVVQEQLGLKLEAQKAPLEVLVIDHIETPSEN